MFVINKHINNKYHKMNFDNMNLIEFIDYIITFDNIHDIINNFDLQHKKYCVFNRIFEIIIKLGYCDIFPNTIYKHMIKTDEYEYKIIKDIYKHFNQIKVFDTIKDIVLLNKLDNTYVYIHSKYPLMHDDLRKQKLINYYKLYDTIDSAKQLKNYKMCLIVLNKKDVTEKVFKANKKKLIISEKNIFDTNDLNYYFKTFKYDLLKNYNENWNEIYYFSKKYLFLRFHQKLIVDKTLNLIEEKNKIISVHLKSHSGKTYIIASFIFNLLKENENLNIMLIIPTIYESVTKFKKKFFRQFKEFDSFNIFNIKNEEKINSLKMKLKLKEGNLQRNIFIIPNQLIKNYTKNNIIKKIKNKNINCIIFDESYLNNKNYDTSEIIKSYESLNTKILYLTTCFTKPNIKWNVPPTCQITWNIEDEEICKSIYKSTIDDNNYINNNIDEINDKLEILKNKHIEYFINSLIKYYEDKGFTLNDIFKYYFLMPELHILSNMSDSSNYISINKKINNVETSNICFDTLYMLDETKTKFIFENEVKLYLHYITGFENPNAKTIYRRINDVRSLHSNETPFTQIWFLPSKNIKEIFLCLMDLIKNDRIYKYYDYELIEYDTAKNINKKIKNAEEYAKEKGKYSLILFSDNNLPIGLTLKYCGIVMLMNNTMTMDMILQNMYRCMNHNKEKNVGYIVDSNNNRIFNYFMEWNTSNDIHFTNIDEKIKYMIDNHLITIDSDKIYYRKTNLSIIIQTLLNER